MVKNILLIIFIMCLTLTSQTLLKKGLNKIGELKGFDIKNIYLFLTKLVQNKFIIIGVIIAAIAAFLWLTVISRMELTKVFPVSGGIFYILLFLSSWFFLGEVLTFWKILGGIIIIIGIIIILK